MEVEKKLDRNIFTWIEVPLFKKYRCFDEDRRDRLTFILHAVPQATLSLARIRQVVVMMGQKVKELLLDDMEFQRIGSLY